MCRAASRGAWEALQGRREKLHFRAAGPEVQRAFRPPPTTCPQEAASRGHGADLRAHRETRHAPPANANPCLNPRAGPHYHTSASRDATARPCVLRGPGFGPGGTVRGTPHPRDTVLGTKRASCLCSAADLPGKPPPATWRGCPRVNRGAAPA